MVTHKELSKVDLVDMFYSYFHKPYTEVIEDIWNILITGTVYLLPVSIVTQFHIVKLMLTRDDKKCYIHFYNRDETVYTTDHEYGRLIDMEAYQSLPMEFCIGISPEMIRYPSAEFVDGAIHRFCGMVVCLFILDLELLGV